MFGGEPVTVLKALGYFNDGDLQTPTGDEMATLRAACDRVVALPQVTLTPGSLSGR